MSIHLCLASYIRPRKDVLTTRRTALTKDNKFRDFLLVCKDMADLASNEGMVRFSSKLDAVRTMLQFWKEGKQVVIMGVSDGITVPDVNEWPNEGITVPDEN